MKRIYVGPKQSTIENNNFFDYSITLFGNNSKTNTSYENFLTFEYWNPDNHLKEITLYNRELSKINEPAEIMGHDPLLTSQCTLPQNIQQICLNDLNLLNKLNNKFITRELLNGIVPMLKYYMVKGIDFHYSNFNKISQELVIQLPIGSGGSKTFFCNKENYTQIESMLLKNELYSISAYERDNIPYNIHCLIGTNQIEILPPSEQELEIIDKIEYIGSNYNINISNEIKNKIIKYSYIICQKLQSLGYLGVLGIDYIYTKNELYFIEINPRFQGSTRQVDKMLIDSNLPSIFEYNFNLFLGKDMPSTKNMKYSLF